MNDARNSMKLLEMIKGITYKFKGRKNKNLALYRLKKNLCNFTQQKDVTLNVYYEHSSNKLKLYDPTEEQ